MNDKMHQFENIWKKDNNGDMYINRFLIDEWKWHK